MTAKFKETVRSLLPRRLKMHRIRGGPLVGYRIHTSWHDYPGAIRGSTETLLLSWLSRNVGAGETWLDIGAHYGYTGIALSKLVGTGGRVMAFEPVAATAACTTRTREANQLAQLQIVPVGLSSEPGIFPCRLPVYRGMADANSASSGWTGLVLLAGFDGLWETLCEDNPAVHGVKIDVQGMEGAVLTGMVGTLRRWRPKLVVEFHAGVDRKAILDLVEECGYDRLPHGIECASSQIEDDKSYSFVPQA